MSIIDLVVTVPKASKHEGDKDEKEARKTSVCHWKVREGKHCDCVCASLSFT